MTLDPFRYRADYWPVLAASTLFAADLAVFFLAPSLILVIAWMLIGIFPKACICSFGHHHQHLPTFKLSILNRLMELVYGFQTGATSEAWYLHHVIGHHRNYLDQEADESRWKRLDGTPMGVVEYSLHNAFFAYFRALKSGLARRRYRQRVAMFLLMGTIQLGLLGLLFAHNWAHALVLFAIPMVMGVLITVWHTFYHHAGLETDDDHEASYNIMHTWYNRLSGNLGYHTAHHIRGGLHWSKLPEYHASIAHRIPKELYREPCFPFWLFGRAENPVETTGGKLPVADTP